MSPDLKRRKAEEKIPDSALCVGMRGFFGLMHWRDKQSFVWVEFIVVGAHEDFLVVLSAAPGMNAKHDSNLVVMTRQQVLKDMYSLEAIRAKLETAGKTRSASQMRVYLLTLNGGVAPPLARRPVGEVCEH